jgi:hypothetical protein
MSSENQLPPLAQLGAPPSYASSQPPAMETQTQFHDPSSLSFPSAPTTQLSSRVQEQQSQDQSLEPRTNTGDVEYDAKATKFINRIYHTGSAAHSLESSAQKQRAMAIQDLVSSNKHEDSYRRHEPLPSFGQVSADTVGPFGLAHVREAYDSGNGNSIRSPGASSRRAESEVSMEDPDVRIAAQALGDLRAGTELSTFHTRIFIHLMSQLFNSDKH